MPPNVTITKIIYSNRQQTEVDMEWILRTDGDMTGFIVERRRVSPPTQGKGMGMAKRDAGDPPWQKVAANLEPGMRSYKMGGFEPHGRYAVRIMAINHRTIGHPSDAKSPGEVIAWSKSKSKSKTKSVLFVSVFITAVDI